VVGIRVVGERVMFAEWGGWVVRFLDGWSYQGVLVVKLTIAT
jgi:hypothetical protein